MSGGAKKFIIKDVHLLIVSYIDRMFNNGGSSYDKVKCKRDAGLLVDAVVTDLLFSGDTQSTFAGIQYWNQASYVGAIASELTTTTSAISYLQGLAQKLVTNNTGGTRYQNTVTQVTNLTPATSAEGTTVLLLKALTNKHNTNDRMHNVPNTLLEEIIPLSSLSITIINFFIFLL